MRGWRVNSFVVCGAKNIGLQEQNKRLFWASQKGIFFTREKRAENAGGFVVRKIDLLALPEIIKIKN